MYKSGKSWQIPDAFAAEFKKILRNSDILIKI
jgi:hypothetical protein